MRTIKLVVIGDSGVGKTSLRGQYVSGRFSAGYRATIGADFISHSVPHHSHPDENITLQIWDTAGQERFSALSSAFFRGADAALLMYDVTRPDTLAALERWWGEFRARAPVPDDELEQFCVVVVGNKTDLIPTHEAPAVNARDAQRLLDTLVPPASPHSSPLLPESDVEAEPPARPVTLFEDAFDFHGAETEQEDGDDGIAIRVPPASQPIALEGKRRPKSAASRRSASLAQGTMSSVRTGLTLFHTPSSSLTASDSDAFASARATPLGMRSPESSVSRSASSSRGRRRTASVCSAETASTSTSVAPTITPLLFSRPTQPEIALSPRRTSSPSPPPPTSFPPSPATETEPALRTRPSAPEPETGPRHFRASAKTGDGVAAAFEYVAERVVRRWEWAEAQDARAFRYSEGRGSVLRLDGDERGRRRARAACCAA